MTPTQTLTLIAEEIEAGAEALYYAMFGESAMKWECVADGFKIDFRQRSAAVLTAAGAVRKAAVPVVTGEMCEIASSAFHANTPNVSPHAAMRAALTAVLTEPTP